MSNAAQRQRLLQFSKVCLSFNVASRNPRHVKFASAVSRLPQHFMCRVLESYSVIGVRGLGDECRRHCVVFYRYGLGWLVCLFFSILLASQNVKKQTKLLPDRYMVREHMVEEDKEHVRQRGQGLVPKGSQIDIRWNSKVRLAAFVWFNDVYFAMVVTCCHHDYGEREARTRHTALVYAHLFFTMIRLVFSF